MIRRIISGVVVCWILAGGVPARASVTLLVHEAIGFEGELAGAGHAAVYLSNLCSDDLVTVRLCRAGEEGVVLSTYPSFVPGEAPYWLAVPLSVYLYGVPATDTSLVYANLAVLKATRRAFAERTPWLRERGLDVDGQPIGTWPLLVGNVLQRTVYALTLATTPEEDARIIEVLADVQRRRVFDLSYNNCADFSRFVINSYFPGAVGRDVVNDFSFTTPKAIARALSAYADRHPERPFRVTRYDQVPGPLPRSRPVRHMSEKFVSSRKYFALFLLLNPMSTVALTAIHGATGTIDLDDMVERSDRAGDWSAERGEVSWRQYRETVRELEREAVARGLFDNRGELRAFADAVQRVSDVQVTPGGEVHLRVGADGKSRLIALGHDGIAEPPSDPQLSYQLVLSLASRDLAGKQTAAPAEALAKRLGRLTRLRSHPDTWTPTPRLACPGTAICEAPPRPAWWKRLLLLLTR